MHFHPKLKLFDFFTFCCLQSFYTEFPVSHLQDDCHAFWKLTHSLCLTPKHTHTPSALVCESCEVLRLAFSIWSCYCSMYERSEWRQRLPHSPSLSSTARFTPIICTVSVYSGFISCHCMSVLESMSLCWQGYGEIRCVQMFCLTCKCPLLLNFMLRSEKVKDYCQQV